MTESERIRRAIEQIAGDKIKDDTAACLRLYKAAVTTAPDSTTGLCGVMFVGEGTEIMLPYSNNVANAKVGEIVLVAVPFDNFVNGVVWTRPDFNSAVGGGEGGGGVENYQNPVLFPTVGKENTLYISDDENALYRWDETGEKYLLVGKNYDAQLQTINTKVNDLEIAIKNPILVIPEI